jgi:hypothetical protein
MLGAGSYRGKGRDLTHCAGGVDAAKRAAATDVEVRLASGGFRVVAESPGRSLLYLSLQFSHCLRLQAEEGDGGGARLLRMNGIGTSILFDRRLAPRLVYFTGLSTGRAAGSRT